MKKRQYLDSQIMAILKQAQTGTLVPQFYREQDIILMLTQPATV